MSKLFNALKSELNIATTYNGAVTYLSSENDIVDLFSSISSSRNNDLTIQFARAFSYDKELACRILLWSRDIRGGAGERNTFRQLLNYLSTLDKEYTKAVISKVPEIGRWDDILHESDNITQFSFPIIKDALYNNNALCAKWMPRKGIIANNLRKYLKLNPKQYRKLLVNLTNVVESKMCNNDWNNIKYSHVPSKAFSNYFSAFKKHDNERFNKFLSDVSDGKDKINAAAIFPYDIIKNINIDSKAVELQWNQLPNYLIDNKENLLVLVDVSASMNTPINRGESEGKLSCMLVAISLGMYIAERTEGFFKNKFITFEESPHLIEMIGDLNIKYKIVSKSPWGGNTNINAVFDLILNTAKKNKINKKDMPSKIIILSDMEFDKANGNRCTNYDGIKDMYKDFRYKRPDIIFWNLQSRLGNIPVKFDSNKTALISGYSPAILKNILSNNLDKMTPYNLMIDTIMNDRYNLVI